MEPSTPSLAQLRAMVDAIDHQLLQGMARRMAIVSEMAAYKRAHGVRIRDQAREQEILHDRRARAEALGLPADDVESIFRLLLRSSREQQVVLRTEVPADAVPVTVAVIGGQGQMGRVMVRLFSALGHTVLVADQETTLTPVEAAARAQVVVVAVPIDATEAVIRAVGPKVRPDGLLMDITSIKAAPVAAMLEATPASVVGTHPMFGPGVHSLQGQRIVLCRGRGDRWADWLHATLTARGLTVTEATPMHHDRAMAIVQVLTHFQTQVMGITLARLGVPLSDTLPFTSPAYLLELFVAARHFAQDPGLYGPIEMRNPATASVTAAFQQTARELAEVLSHGDRGAFAALFEEVRHFFGTFTEDALEQSSFLIDRIVERA